MSEEIFSRSNRRPGWFSRRHPTNEAHLRAKMEKEARGRARYGPPKLTTFDKATNTYSPR